MNDDTLSNPVVLSESDLQDAFRLLRGTGWPERLALAPLDVTLALWWLVGLLFLVFGRWPAPFWVATTAAALWTLGQAFEYGLMRVRVAGLYRRQASLREACRYAFDGDGIAITTATSTVRIPWAQIKRWKQNRRTILLFMSLTVFIAIPRRCLAADQTTALLTTLRARKTPEMQPQHRQPLRWFLAVMPLVLSLAFALLVFSRAAAPRSGQLRGTPPLARTSLLLKGPGHDVDL